ncbi:hypothetical protein PVAP13_1NG339419 [Panicum virgatum]|uniref:Uncharacterized protein n=1 Tax=Panicum virgatum TaxID=38727 RepID=A0A8T0WRS9_PANVG|nr:hypothetical protein PVAP13_1NG339419 [Panicum virgatum]
MSCCDLRVGAGWIHWNRGLGRVGLTPPVLRLRNSRTGLASRELPHGSGLGRLPPPPPVVATPPACPALLHNSFRSRSTGDRTGYKSSGGGRSFPPASILVSRPRRPPSPTTSAAVGSSVERCSASRRSSPWSRTRLRRWRSRQQLSLAQGAGRLWGNKCNK